VIGPESSIERGSAVSFVLEGLHPHDVGQVMDESGIAVRVGQHCAKPACLRYGVQATTRATFYIYNDLDDVDALVAGIYSAKKFFGV
jgi:cysteine desulfurase/selenocysteine lyase